MTDSPTTAICPQCIRRVDARPVEGGLLMSFGDHHPGCLRDGTVKTNAEIARWAKTSGEVSDAY